MKKIILKTVMHNVLGNDQELNYRDQLVGLVSVVEAGMTIVDMRKIERVVDKLESPLGQDNTSCFVVLEDAEHATLKAALENAKFRIYTKQIKQMIESVINAKDPTVEPIMGSGKLHGKESI